MVSIGIIFPVIATIFTDPSSPSFLLTGYAQNSWIFIAGVVTAIFGVMQFFAAPLLGELSDVYGRKKLLLTGVSILAASQFLFGLGIVYGSLAIVCVSRAIAGLAAANFSIAQATIADISLPEDRAKNFGLMGAAFGIGFIVGPLLGGWLAHLGTAATPFWFAGILGICNACFLAYFLTETRHVTEKKQHTFTLAKGIHNIRAAFKDKDALPVYMTSFVFLLGFSFFTSFSGIYMVEKFGFTPGQLGSYFAVIGICIAITQAGILRLVVARYTEKQILFVSLLALASSFFAYMFVPTALLQYFFVPLIAVPQGLTMASIGALVSKSVSADKQGAALGINGSLQALGGGIAPLIGGAGSSIFGNTFPFYIASLACLAAWSVLFVFLKRT
jgi:DHA1 family tetracycline resistance protein-like MFS transporter